MDDIANSVQEKFVSAGTQMDMIDVRISHRIIQLFSEGLYSSSNKAVEELVSNSFDAGAQNVHVILSPDLRDPDATIVVIDDGEGMDVEGLKQHWIIGLSTRREDTRKRGRKPIGKFGIGKLATYVLAARLTHICKSKGNFYAATMDYSKLGPQKSSQTVSDTDGIFNDEKISIPLRILTETEAKELLRLWTASSKAGYAALKLFGDDAKDSWTVAVMSGLTEMGKKVRRGQLKWILRTAMPLRDDFKLFLDGELIESSKIDFKLIDKWIIGKDIHDGQLKDPCPKGLIPTEDEGFPKDSIHRYGLSHEQLGRVTGYVELFEDELPGGKSDEIERSNGFFVYVRGRMINIDDPGFGIGRNLLRHGTFSKFRMVVHIDSLDDVLRSSRESLQQGDLHNLARNFLHAVFNLARNRLVEHERSQSPGALIANRISSAPGSLTRKPLLALAELAIEGRITPLYTRLPTGLTDVAKKEFLKQLQKKAESQEGLLQAAELVELDTKDGLAIYEIEKSKLLINTSHPFVAAFQELFTKFETSLPLEMYAMTEVLTEAHLYHMNLEENTIRDILARRDELLRQFVRSSARRTAGMIALALMDAKDNEDKLEEEMRAAFEAIGFANVIRIGGSGKPDGTAEAHLPASDKGALQRYKVGLEAKSGGIVSAQRLGVSGIARHMEDYHCDHHVVIGNGFATSKGDEGAATIREINDHKKNTGRTITLMHIDDLARLVRLVPTKRIGLNRLRELFLNCTTPEESKAWVDNIAQETPANWPYREILDTIWERANSRPNEAVEYAAVVTALEYRTPPIRITKQELIDCCKAMQVIAMNVIFARDGTVELNRRPDLVIEDIRVAIKDYPENERKTIVI
jgi:hypothetical protein